MVRNVDILGVDQEVGEQTPISLGRPGDDLAPKVKASVGENIGRIDSILSSDKNKDTKTKLDYLIDYLDTHKTEIEDILEAHSINEDDFDFIVSQIVKSEKEKEGEGDLDLDLEMVYVDLFNHFSGKIGKDTVIEILISIRDLNIQFRYVGRKLSDFLEDNDLSLDWKSQKKIELGEEMFEEKSKYILDDFISLNGEEKLSIIFEKTNKGYSLMFTKNIGLERPFDKTLGTRGRFTGTDPKKIFEMASKEFHIKYPYKLEFEPEKWR